MKKSLTDIHLFRVVIGTLRQAEHDYLIPPSADISSEARVFLFGRRSEFDEVCRALGLDPNASRLALIAYKVKHAKNPGSATDDPVFGFLAKNASYDNFTMGKPIGKPTHEAIRKFLHEQNPGNPNQSKASRRGSKGNRPKNPSPRKKSS
jgi:hypothetical protein